MGKWNRDGSNIKRSLWPFTARQVVLIFILFAFVIGVIFLVRSLFDPSKKTIAFIPQTAGTELWEAAHVGAQVGGQQSGYRIYWNAPTRDDDAQRQIELIETAIHNRDAGLIVAPIQYLALISPLREALAKHIPAVVVSTSLPIPASNGLTYVLSDDVEAGRIAARQLGVLLKGSGNVAILGVNPNVTGVMERLHSFETTMATEFPGISIVEMRMASASSAESGDIAESVLLEHPDLRAFFGLSSTSTEGALTALHAAHETPRVFLVGCDQELDIMQSMREGDVDAIVVQNSYSMGFQAVGAIAASRSGKPGPQEILIAPILVTRANVDDPAVQKLLSVNWRPGR
jgi:ribose transport system substrate-binding protein